MTSYITFTKHVEKMLKKVSGSRPVLKGMYHPTDGHVIATDSHRLYKLHNGYQTETAFIQNPTTGEYIEGNYPDTTRLIPEAKDACQTVQVDVKQLHDATKAMLAAHKTVNVHAYKHLTLQLKATDYQLSLVAGKDTDAFKASYSIGAVQDNDIHIHMNGQFLIDALALFKDAGETTINLRMFGNMRPFLLESKDVTALIMPVRKY